MRRRQFVELIYDLRAELERNTDPAAGVGDLQSLRRHLQRTYETIYDDYDWPHLTVTNSVSLSAGQRFYDVPATLDYDKLVEIRLFWNSLPTPISRGISLDDFATYNSDDDDRSDPVQKWDIRYTDIKEQIEVWPIPATSGDSINFIGKRKFTQLVDDADRCLIDDHVVVLSAAVELLPEKSAGKLKLKLAALQSRYNRIKGRSKAGSGSVRIGLGSPAPSSQGLVLRVRG
jgi:hypothetical protein